MGLDSIEIVMEVENAFGISIPDVEAERIRTVGDFHNLVWEYVKDRKDNKCKSQVLFYRLRKSFGETLNIPKRSIDLATDPSQIVPMQDRRSLWYKVSETSALEFPGLGLTSGYYKLLLVIGSIAIIGGMIASIVLINLYDLTKWAMLIPLGGLIFTIRISKLLDFKRIIIRQPDFKDLTREVLALNYKLLSKENGVNRKEVEFIITSIIADKGGLDRSEVTPEKRIHDDLGID